MTRDVFQPLLVEIRACQLCKGKLPHAPRPVLQASAAARILIVSQAPGRKVHASGIPFDDVSGDRLRAWLGIDKTRFYNAEQVAIIGTGFCFPGTTRGADLPPRPECAPHWYPRLLPLLVNVRLTLAVGQYSIVNMLPESGKRTLTAAVQAWRRHLARKILPLPHPSPRNQLWLKRNPWFENELLPVLREEVLKALRS